MKPAHETQYPRPIPCRLRPHAGAGDPQRVRDGLLRLAGRYNADELMLLTITGDYASRSHSYELVAEAFDLERAAQPA